MSELQGLTKQQLDKEFDRLVDLRDGCNESIADIRLEKTDALMKK